MSRVTIPTRNSAPADSRPLLDAVLKKFGIIPNLFRLGALGPNTLAGLLSLNEANSKSHAALNRKGAPTDAKTSVAVRFAAKVAEQRTKVTDDDVAPIKSAGYTDAQIVEIVRLVAEKLTNFLNNVAQTDIDFPALHTAQAA